MAASDPFFGNYSELKKVAQLGAGTKYEIQSLLPYDNTYLAITSFNNHGSIFFDRFNISSNNPDLVHSGCIGWGYERLLYTILSQKGLDFSSKYYNHILK